jgi:hypothetical protein
MLFHKSLVRSDGADEVGYDGLIERFAGRLSERQRAILAPPSAVLHYHERGGDPQLAMTDLPGLIPKL